MSAGRIAPPAKAPDAAVAVEAPRRIRSVLAVTCAGSQVAAAAAEFAAAHNAPLRLVEAWSEPRLVWWIGSAGWSLPVTPHEIRAEEEQAADERARRAFALCDGTDVSYRCRRGRMAVVAAREALRGEHDVVFVDARCRGRRLLAGLLRRRGVMLVLAGGETT